MILPPKNIETVKGEIADYWYSPEGILYSYSKPPKRTVESITRNVALVKEITGNKPVPLLIYLCDSPIPDKAARKFSTEQLPVIYKAMAMVSKPGLAQFIMSILFRFQNPPIPMKSFASDEEAKTWLLQYV